MNSLKAAIRALTPALLIGFASVASAAPEAEDPATGALVVRKCAPLIDRQVAQWGDAARLEELCRGVL